MTRRRVEHGANHDITVLAAALAILALLYLAGQTIAIDEPQTPAPGQRNQPAPDQPSGGAFTSGEASERAAVGVSCNDYERDVSAVAQAGRAPCGVTPKRAPATPLRSERVGSNPARRDVTHPGADA